MSTPVPNAKPFFYVPLPKRLQQRGHSTAPHSTKAMAEDFGKGNRKNQNRIYKYMVWNCECRNSSGWNERKRTKMKPFMIGIMSFQRKRKNEKQNLQFSILHILVRFGFLFYFFFVSFY